MRLRGGFDGVAHRRMPAHSGVGKPSGLAGEPEFDGNG